MYSTNMYLISVVYNYVGVSNSNNGNNVGTIVGVVAGVLIIMALTIIVSIMLFCYHKSKL